MDPPRGRTTITDDPEYLYQLGYFIGQFPNLKALDILPYHTMGKVKYDSLGIDYPLKDIPAMDSKRAIELKKSVLEESGIAVWSSICSAAGSRVFPVGTCVFGRFILKYKVAKRKRRTKSWHM